jgi:archaellum biogenesis ATPase FlaH
MELMDQYKLLQEGLDSNGVVDDSIFIGLDAGTFDKNVGTPEFKINPASLNKRLDGGAAREDHIGVFARPEIGKSLFCINLMSGCLRRGFKGLYFGNEDAAEKMRLRFICNLLNLNKFEVLEDFEANAAEAMAKGGNNLIFKRSDAGTIHELDTIMTHHKPDIFVVDQIRNFTVPGSKDGGLTHTIEQVAKGCRTLAKKHRALAVSVTQAGATAANQSVLEPEDVDYSNTGYFGALDLLIGIGANKQQLDNNRRYLYLSKNKLSDRHEGFTVKFEHATSRVKSID